MAIKHGSKVDKSYSAASMTDLMFLLLIFLLVATTLINPNALKLMLPKSANQLKDKAITTVSIQQDGNRYNYYVELERVDGIDGVEQAFLSLLKGIAQNFWKSSTSTMNTVAPPRVTCTGVGELSV